MPGTPRWAVVAAYAVVASVLPSSGWRIAVGAGVPLGWSDAQLAAQHMPGWGTVYVVGLSLGSLAAAALTLGLVQCWGEVIPDRLPVLGGRHVPLPLAVALALFGVIAVTGVEVLSLVHWNQVSGFGHDARSGAALFMAACYAPALLWPPLLLATTAAYVSRRRRGRRNG